MSIGMSGISSDVIRVGDAAEDGGVVQQLRDKLEYYKQRRARQAGWTRRFVPTGLAPLDAALPHGGMPCGAITEILAGGPGCGAMSLAMRIAGNSVKQTQGFGDTGVSAVPAGGIESTEEALLAERWHPPRSIVLVDTFQDFYPPAACQHGIALDRLIVLRVSRPQDAFWAVDQSLRCSSVSAVIAPFKRFDDRGSRRLQLAAESSGCLGLILRPALRRTRSFAAVQVLIESVRANEWMESRSRTVRWMGPEQSSWSSAQASACLRATHRQACPHANLGDASLCRITLLKIREGMPVEPILVDLQHETATVHLHSLPVGRSAAKTG